MSILSHFFAGRYTKLTRRHHAVEIMRLPEAPTALAVLPVRDEPGKLASLTEHARPHEQTDEAERFTWHVRIHEYGSLVESKGFDVLRDAQAYLAHVVTPLPTFEPLPEVSDYADEPDTLPESLYHDPSEQAWWSRQTGGGVVEGQPDPNDLIYSTEAADDWLDDLTADQMQALSDDFGGGFIGGFESW